LNQREEVVTELSAKLSAMNAILEEQQTQQTTTVERIQKSERELEDMASNIALAKENLKEKDASLDKRATDLAWPEKDLAFKEEMFERRDKLLAEHELEAEQKEKELEDRIRQLQAAQAPHGPKRWRRQRKHLKISRRSIVPGSSASLHGPAKRARRWCR
jgi:chromosome segregation ATPase